MGFAEIKENVKELSDKERRALVAYLVQLEKSTDPGYIERITNKIDDSKSYVRWNDIKDEFGKD